MYELKITNLKKTYLLPGRGLSVRKALPQKKQALAGVSLDLAPGLYGLLGPNGAGKSTLIHIITGTLAPDSGEVLWCGKPASGIAFRRILGYMPQQQGLYDSYTGRRFLAYMAALKEIPRAAVPGEVARVAAAVNLTDELDKRLSAYSGGMKQRLGIAAAVMEHPDLILLDEPTNALDESGVDMLGDIVKKEKERGAVLIVSSHDRDILEDISDEIYDLEQGEIVRHSVKGGEAK